MCNTNKQEYYLPIGKRVLVEKPKAREEVRNSGLVVPVTVASSPAHSTNVGIVLAVGTGVEDKELTEGVKIKFVNPQEVSHEGKEYYLIHENNIQFIIKNVV